MQGGVPAGAVVLMKMRSMQDKDSIRIQDIAIIPLMHIDASMGDVVGVQSHSDASQLGSIRAMLDALVASDAGDDPKQKLLASIARSALCQSDASAPMPSSLWNGKNAASTQIAPAVESRDGDTHHQGSTFGVDPEAFTDLCNSVRAQQAMIAQLASAVQDIKGLCEEMRQRCFQCHCHQQRKEG
jgi:hypothetical protein